MAKKVLQVLTYFDHFFESNGTETKESVNETEELGQTFKSLSCVVFLVVLFGYFFEVHRMAYSCRITYDLRANDDNQEFFSEDAIEIDKIKSYVMCYHFVTLYSIFFYLFGLYLPSLVHLTYNYFVWKIQKDNYWLDSAKTLTVKALVVIFLWSFFFLWLFTDQEILNYSYKEFADSSVLWRYHKNFIWIILALEVMRKIYEVNASGEHGWSYNERNIEKVWDLLMAIDGTTYTRY